MARIIEKLRSIEDAEKASKGRGSINKKAKNRKGRTPGSIILPKASQDLFSITNTTTAPSPSSEPKSFRDILDTRFPWELKDEVEEEEEEEEDEDDDNDEGDEEGDKEEFGLNKADYAYGDEEDGKQRKRRGPPSLAERTISEKELKRLRGLANQMTNKLKVGRLGITEGIVLAIHQKWRKAELVKVRCIGTTAQNMREIHEDLEKKTGGLVVWRSGAAAVIYRGEDYDYDAIMSEYWNSSAASAEVNVEADKGFEDDSDSEDSEISNEDNDEEISTTPPAKPRSRMPFVDIEYAMEVENILQELGPRYEDWGGPRPVPIDGDLLPPIILDYKPPFRFLPYGMKPKLTDFELTKIRRMSRPLPPHFAIGRNRGLQGVAVAMVRLWEKSEVAKISVKRGVQNTNNERIAEELKRLTGGVLISRDKHFITLYRGKDFLPVAVASALSERQALASVFQEEEEKFQAGSSTVSVVDVQTKPSTAGTLSESLEVKQLYERQMNSEEHRKLRVEAEKATKLEAKRKIERRLSLAVSKIERAQREQEKLERSLIPSEAPEDRETLTEEERFMFRKLGLRMKPFLLLGKRGIFDGIVENMHLHWKYRELVKIICKERDPSQLKNTARMLEYESGGVLVAVELTSKGHAIIVYRGKNYQRPSQLRPKNLLTKRKALKRAQELQRQESLSKITVALQKEIDKMKADLDELSESQMEISSKASGDLNDTQDMQEEVSDTDIASLKDERELNDTQDIQSEYNYGLENEDAFDGDLSGEAIENDRGGLELDAASVDGFGFDQFDGGIPSGSSKALAYHEKKSLEEEATRMCKAAHYHVGKSKDLEKLTKLIHSHFERHSLVKIGVKIKPQGMTVLEIGQLLERSTGGVLVSTTPTKIVLFRGHEERHIYSSFSQQGEKPHTPLLIETSSNIDERLEEDSGSLVNHEDLAVLINGEQCDFLVSSSVEEALDNEEIYTSGKLKDGDQSGEEDARGQLESRSESFVNVDIV